jgi:hypothetical protein
VQALLGFQLIVVLTEAFDALPDSSVLVHLAALAAIALSGGAADRTGGAPRTVFGAGIGGVPADCPPLPAGRDRVPGAGHGGRLLCHRHEGAEFAHVRRDRGGCHRIHLPRPLARLALGGKR